MSPSGSVRLLAAFTHPPTPPPPSARVPPPNPQKAAFCSFQAAFETRIKAAPKLKKTREIPAQNRQNSSMNHLNHFKHTHFLKKPAPPPPQQAQAPQKAAFRTPPKAHKGTLQDPTSPKNHPLTNQNELTKLFYTPQKQFLVT